MCMNRRPQACPMNGRRFAASYPRDLPGTRHALKRHAPMGRYIHMHSKHKHTYLDLTRGTYSSVHRRICSSVHVRFHLSDVVHRLSANIRQMGGAPRNPAPGNHLLVWILKPSGCHCTGPIGGETYRRVPTPLRSASLPLRKGTTHRKRKTTASSSCVSCLVNVCYVILFIVSLDTIF